MVRDLEKEEFRVFVDGFKELALFAIHLDFSVDILLLARSILEENRQFLDFLLGLLALQLLLLLIRLLIELLLYLMLKCVVNYERMWFN